MKIADIINGLKVGQVITNKRLLSVLKRKGLIYDYSQWGYLESCWVVKPAESDGYRYRHLGYLFNGNAPKDTNCVYCETENEFDNLTPNEIEYMGCRFRTKYLSGCFNAYLELVSKNGDSQKEVNQTMSLWGAVC